MNAPSTPADPNAATVAVYETHAQHFQTRAPQVTPEPVKWWLACALQGVAPPGRILELGSGTGRDALYLSRLGFPVLCTDAARSMVDLCREAGLRAVQADVLRDDLVYGLNEGRDLAVANVVLPHMTFAQAHTATRRVHAVLRPGGRFAFTLRPGEGSYWTQTLGARRFFQLWQPSQVHWLLAEAGFDRWCMTELPGSRSDSYLHVVAVKGPRTGEPHPGGAEACPMAVRSVLPSRVH